MRELRELSTNEQTLPWNDGLRDVFLREGAMLQGVRLFRMPAGAGPVVITA